MNASSTPSDVETALNELRAELRESYRSERAAQARVVELEEELRELRVHGLTRSLARASGLIKLRDVVKESVVLRRSRTLASTLKKRAQERLK
ncbi:hypothetical protein [Zhihengliuella flava]|uniref:Uncharacterized protein with von Willebrand factor type A (VWA) domain n=1 Tax=Zhihengliuella flava TaxID=1285193 RepID=A0A931D6W6_9MICC|nr:hypothetical protein [Zhihengliuella flava]MBG6083514.1 uncharacterized protein with von Willebrand factor type A (vWA) domain [Zhihengliuella flava]